MATKVLKEYTLEEISEVNFQLSDLPVMFLTQQWQHNKEGDVVGWIVFERFLSTSNNIDSGLS